MSVPNVPHEAVLVFTSALSGILCVGGYLAAFALTRRLHPCALRPVIGLGEMLRPLAVGMLLGVAILFCRLSGDPADPAIDASAAPLASILLMVGLAGIGAGGWAACRHMRRPAIPVSDLVSRLCVAGNTHEDATARVAVRLALAAGYDPARAGDLMAAASLHDIGKSGVAGTILSKQGPLDAAEQRALQNHTRIGFRMLAHSHEPMLDLAADIALHHHENWDGTGYPCGLSGETIPLPSRVVALAETFDELLGESGDPAGLDRAIRLRSGKQLDPALVSLLLADLPGMIAARGAGVPRRPPVAAAPLAAWLHPARFRPVPSHHVAI